MLGYFINCRLFFLFEMQNGPLIYLDMNHYVQGTEYYLLGLPTSIGLHLMVLAVLALVVVGIKDGKAIQKIGFVLFVMI